MADFLTQDSSEVDRSLVFRLVEQLTDLVHAEDAPAIESFLAAHPEHAKLLRELLPSLEILSRLNPSAVEGLEKRPRSALSLGASHGVLGDFQIIQEIGRGGMGIVFEAQQLSLDRRVALKVLPYGGLLEAHQLQRFKNEARAAAGLHHPNIVPVYAVGAERGIQFYAMQLVNGGTLADLIRRAKCEQRQLPIGNVVQWGIEIAEALRYAHSVGVIHRDIKPGNLMLDESGRVLLTDFGLALFESEAALTLTGDVIGTLRYVSPEQALGERGVVSARSDVYSLGATLYELLTLRPLFEMTNRRDLIRSVIHDEPVSLRKLAPAVPVDLETIVMKSLQKDPAARYENATQFVDDLKRFGQQRPILARRTRVPQRFWHWTRRNSTLAIASCMFVCLLLVSGLVAQHFYQFQRIQAQASREALEAHEYVTQINLAELAWKARQWDKAREHLGNCIPQGQEVDRRSFEWDYLWQHFSPTAHVLGRHEGNAYCVRVSPDGKVLASCGQDGIRIWDRASGRQMHLLQVHRSDVNTIHFSPDGALAASAGDDGTVRIWSTADWTIRKSLQYTGAALAAVFSPKENRLAVAERHFLDSEKRRVGRNVVHIVDAGNWESFELSPEHADVVQSIVFSPDGTLVASASEDGFVHVWDAKSSKLKYRLSHQRPAGPSGIHALAFAHRTPLLAAVGVQGITHVWRMEDGSLQLTLPGVQKTLESVCFSPDDGNLIAGGSDQTIYLWHLRREPAVGADVTYVASANLWCVAEGDGSEVYSAGRDGVICRWDTDKPFDRLRIPLPYLGLPGFALMTDQTILAAIPDLLMQFRLSDGTKVNQWPAISSDCARAMSFNPHTRILAAASAAGQLSLLPMGQEVRNAKRLSFKHHVARVELVGGGKQLQVFAHDPCSSTIVDVNASMVVPAPIQLADTDAIFSSPVEDAYLVWRHDESLEGWQGQRRLWKTKLGKDRPTAVAFSRQGDFFAFAADETIQVINTRLGRIEMSVFSDHWPIHELAFSPDAKTVAAACERTGVRLWNLATGRRLVDLASGLHNIGGLRFSEDGGALVISGTVLNQGSELVVWHAAVNR